MVVDKILHVLPPLRSLAQHFRQTNRYFCLSTSETFIKQAVFRGIVKRPILSPVPSRNRTFTPQISSTCQLRFISKKTYKFPEISESDLEELFIRGWGPGGQSVNKTSSCVQLKHRPSGLIIKCQESRTLETNRRRAREILKFQLDVKINGEKSYTSQLRREESEAKEHKKRKSKKNLELKKAFKEREGLN